MPKRRKKITKAKRKELEVRILSKEKIEKKGVNQRQIIMDRETEFQDEQTEQGKKLVMWVGISCIMAIFFIAWILNLKYEFKASAKKSTAGGFNWSQAKVELDKTMKQVKQSIEQIKQPQAGAPSALPEEPELTPEQINLLKGKLLNEAASTTMASSTKE